MKRLFLTLFEEYLLHEDRRAYPFWIGGRFRFRGRLDRGELRAALDKTMRRHPLLSCVVCEQPDGRLYWQPVPEWRAVMDWREDVDGTAGIGWEHRSLREEPGFRLLVSSPVGGDTEVLVQVHHAVLDGLGTFAVFNEILIHYARGRGQAVELPELKPELFEHRNRFGLTWADKVRMVPLQIVGLLVSAQLQGRRVATLVPHRVRSDAEQAPGGWPAVASRPFPEAEYDDIRAAAKRLGAGTNDLFIRDLFAAIGVWRKREGIDAPGDWVRMGIPVSLRGTADRQLSATNVISVVSIDRQTRLLGDRARLLRRAREDMEWIKEKKLSHTFVVMMGIYRHLLGGIRRFTGRPACQSTIMLTNLGQIFSRSPLRDARRKLAVPGAVLDRVTMVAPYRPGTCATLSVGTYGGELLADLHYDPRFLTRAQAEGLLEEFAAQLKASVTEAGG